MNAMSLFYREKSFKNDHDIFKNEPVALLKCVLLIITRTYPIHFFKTSTKIPWV